MNILHLFSKKIQARTTYVYVEKGKTIKMYQNRIKKYVDMDPLTLTRRAIKFNGVKNKRL